MNQALRALVCLSLLLMLLVGSKISTSLAATVKPNVRLQPFSASYHLEVKGWPNTNIEHHLTRENGHWQTQMRAAIAVARGNERSRFIVTPEGVQAVHYSSGYSLLGFGETTAWAAMTWPCCPTARRR